MTTQRLSPSSCWLILTLTLLALAGATFAQDTPAEAAIREVLQAQADAWNRGDVEAFMSVYVRSEEAVYIGAQVLRGYDAILGSYKERYPSPEALGQVTFSDLDIRRLDGDYAIVIGRFSLSRAEEAGGPASGIFSLVMVRSDGDWRILLDHTSS